MLYFIYYSTYFIFQFGKRYLGVFGNVIHFDYRKFYVKCFALICFFVSKYSSFNIHLHIDIVLMSRSLKIIRPSV